MGLLGWVEGAKMALTIAGGVLKRVVAVEALKDETMYWVVGRVWLMVTGSLGEEEVWQEVVMDCSAEEVVESVEETD
jgi:hypothetical protein